MTYDYDNIKVIKIPTIAVRIYTISIMTNINNLFNCYYSFKSAFNKEDMVRMSTQ